MYDVTRRADPYLVERVIHHLGGVPAGRYLDLVCGTGYYTVAVAQTGLRLYGIDRSPRMIAAAQAKSRAVTWHVGDVEALPFPDGLFTGVICTLAIHHFRALRPAFQEAFRVLARGRLVLFTSTAEQMYGYWLNSAAMFAKLLRLPRSSSPPPSPSHIEGWQGSVNPPSPGTGERWDGGKACGPHPTRTLPRPGRGGVSRRRGCQTHPCQPSRGMGYEA